MKFTLSADWHLKPRIWTHTPITGDTFWAAAQVVTHCVRHQLPLIHAGDLFDTPNPSSAAIGFSLDAFEVISTVSNVSPSVMYLPGNHEASDPPWSQVLTNVTDLSDQSVLARDNAGRALTFYGIAHRSFSDLKTYLNEVGTGLSCDVLVMHQLLDQACPLENMHNLKAEDVPSVPLLVMGDLHLPTDITLANGTRAIYPGSPVGMNMLEASRDCGLVEIEDDRSNGFKVTPVGIVNRLVLSPRTHRQLEILDVDSASAFERFMRLEAPKLVTDRDVALAAASSRMHTIFNECDLLPQNANSVFTHLVGAFDPEPIRRPVIQVKFDPDVISLDRVKSAITALAYDTNTPEAHLMPVPSIPKPTVDESATGSDSEPVFDIKDPDSLRPLVSDLVDRESVSPEAGELLVDLISQGDRASSLDRTTLMEKWRSKYELEKV